VTPSTRSEHWSRNEFPYITLQEIALELLANQTKARVLGRASCRVVGICNSGVLSSQSGGDEVLNMSRGCRGVRLDRLKNAQWEVSTERAAIDCCFL